MNCNFQKALFNVCSANLFCLDDKFMHFLQANWGPFNDGVNNLWSWGEIKVILMFDKFNFLEKFLKKQKVKN